jgi:hypothetical protein
MNDCEKIGIVFYIISLSTLEVRENRCREMHSLGMGSNESLPVISTFFSDLDKMCCGRCP